MPLDSDLFRVRWELGSLGSALCSERQGWRYLEEGHMVGQSGCSESGYDADFTHWADSPLYLL